jgi:hypothetical protein
MKKLSVLTASVVALLTLAYATSVYADDKEVTVTGEGKCAKCLLKEADACQNVIQVSENGKTVNYYLAKNDVSENFHKNLCKKAEKVTATGTVKEVDGKKELTAKTIEVAKE